MLTLIQILVYYFLFLGCYGQSTPTSNAAPRATIDSGVVIGKTVSPPNALSPVNQFLGIPFAQSPPQRFSPPQLVANSSRTIDATSIKPACFQEFRYPPEVADRTQLIYSNPRPVESEDCLYLNVYAPTAPAAGAGRPVLFWIFGGSLQFGTGGLPLYDGTNFAAFEDVIIVTSNYRTNIFGFPGSPEIPVTGQNLGFLDQRFALNWVQRNIRAFGGDPSKVTLFGESAGGFSIDALLTSYPKDSKPPFRAAILESGQSTYTSTFYPSGRLAWDNLTTLLGCPATSKSNLTCVRAANATTIKRYVDQYSLSFFPVFDNITFVSDPARRRLSGNIARIPVLGGTNSQEGRSYHIGENNLTASLNAQFGTSAPDFIPVLRATYPLGSPGLANDYDIISQITTDLTFQCPQALWANATAAIGTPTWRYFYNATFANIQPVPYLGAYHGSELGMVFRTYNRTNTTTQQEALSQFIQGAWSRFAKNPEAGPGWNRVLTGAEGSILSGPYDYVKGGILYGPDPAGTVRRSDWSLGVLGDVGNVKGSGVTVLPQKDFDARCAIYRPFFEFFAGSEGMPPT